ncbi:hypothetical protein [Companilactobacillus metriopterae]|uniref:hypothetical protein n=1 Tax=Companilactobacillus metriopterae TaxID=1909267 RepID=UPI00100C102B|nr:hypothetical protein [Companilactobacillus metriopterae]
MKNEYIEKLNEVKKFFPDSNIIDSRIEKIDNIFDTLSNDLLPKENISGIELSEDEITSLFQVALQGDLNDFEVKVNSLEEFDHQLGELRTELQNSFGYWANITEDFMEEFVKQYPNEGFLELMAGNGYISSAINRLGGTAICTDNLSWSKESKTGRKQYTNIEELDALNAIEKYHNQVSTIILAWSPDREEIDYDILELVRKYQLQFLVIGEKNGATNSAKFWSNAQLIDDPKIKKINKFYSNYDIVDDRLYLVE